MDREKLVIEHLLHLHSLMTVKEDDWKDELLNLLYAQLNSNIVLKWVVVQND